MSPAEERDPESELLARLDWLIASLENPSLGGGWTPELASKYAAALREFRERITTGTTTEQDKTMSWARAFDWEGFGYGDPSFLAARMDEARRKYFGSDRL